MAYKGGTVTVQLVKVSHSAASPSATYCVIGWLAALEMHLMLQGLINASAAAFVFNLT
jgi:hypothetical protein